MATHYVYEGTPDPNMLNQGDVLQRTDELVDQIREFFPYYANHPDYKYFMLITQGCDLYRRDGRPCNAQYLTLAAVRPVQDAMRLEVTPDQKDWQQQTKVIGSRVSNKLAMFMERLIDNNVPGYFYLHRDPTANIHLTCCAFLPLTVSLRVQHYDMCLRAKVAQLRETFQAKLGWLLGHMYSRVGTTEWNMHNTPTVREQARHFIEENYVTIDDKQIDEGLADLKKQGQLPEPEAIREYIIAKKVLSRKEKFQARASDVLTTTLQPINTIRKKAVYQVGQDQALRTGIEGVLAQAGIVEDKRGDVANALVQQVIGRLNDILSDEKLEGKADALQSIIRSLLQDTIISGLMK